MSVFLFCIFISHSSLYGRQRITIIHCQSELTHPIMLRTVTRSPHVGGYCKQLWRCQRITTKRHPIRHIIKALPIFRSFIFSPFYYYERRTNATHIWMICWRWLAIDALVFESICSVWCNLHKLNCFTVRLYWDLYSLLTVISIGMSTSGISTREDQILKQLPDTSHVLFLSILIDVANNCFWTPR